jgi:hypothetical protein
MEFKTEAGELPPEDKEDAFAACMPEYQVDLWVNGLSLHNGDRDECCPDFSCCHPDLLSDRDTRNAYKAANWKDRKEMRWIFLSKLILKIYGKQVESCLAGDSSYELPDLVDAHIGAGKLLALAIDKMIVDVARRFLAFEEATTLPPPDPPGAEERIEVHP